MTSRFMLWIAVAFSVLLSGCAEVRRVNENHVRIRGKLYQIWPVENSTEAEALSYEALNTTPREVSPTDRDAPEGFEFERSIVSDFRAVNETLETMFERMLKEIGLDANRVVFFPSSLGKTPVSWTLRNITVADVVKYASELAGADIVRQSELPGPPPMPQGAFILRGRDYAEQMTRVLVLHPQTTADTVAAFVERIAKHDPHLSYEFQEERGILILHGRRRWIEIAEHL